MHDEQLAAKVITDTVQFYEEDPSRRAVLPGGGCKYLTTEGRKCAVGRYMLPGRWQKSCMGVASLMEGHDGPLDIVLQPEVRGLPWRLWYTLQHYHDDGDYWRPDGFSAALRQHAVAKMWQRYCPSIPMPEFKFHGEET